MCRGSLELVRNVMVQTPTVKKSLSNEVRLARAMFAIPPTMLKQCAKARRKLKASIGKSLDYNCDNTEVSFAVVMKCMMCRSVPLSIFTRV